MFHPLMRITSQQPGKVVHFEGTMAPGADSWLNIQPLTGTGLMTLSAAANGCTLTLVATPMKVVAMYSAPSKSAMSWEVRLHFIITSFLYVKAPERLDRLYPFGGVV